MVKLIEIVPGLYTRGELSAGTGVRDLLAAGVRRAMSLTARGEPALQNWSGYFHYPMSDGKRIDEEALKSLSRWILANLAADRPTLVMCHAGRNRTGLVVCYALRELLEITGREALKLFRDRRPRGVANRHFERYLSDLPRPKRS